MIIIYIIDFTYASNISLSNKEQLYNKFFKRSKELIEEKNRKLWNWKKLKQSSQLVPNKEYMNSYLGKRSLDSYQDAELSKKLDSTYKYSKKQNKYLLACDNKSLKIIQTRPEPQKLLSNDTILKILHPFTNRYKKQHKKNIHKKQKIKLFISKNNITIEECDKIIKYLLLLLSLMENKYPNSHNQVSHIYYSIHKMSLYGIALRYKKKYKDKKKPKESIYHVINSSTSEIQSLITTIYLELLQEYNKENHDKNPKIKIQVNRLVSLILHGKKTIEINTIFKITKVIEFIFFDQSKNSNIIESIIFDIILSTLDRSSEIYKVLSCHTTRVFLTIEEYQKTIEDLLFLYYYIKINLPNHHIKLLHIEKYIKRFLLLLNIYLYSIQESNKDGKQPNQKQDSIFIWIVNGKSKIKNLVQKELIAQEELIKQKLSISLPSLDLREYIIKIQPYLTYKDISSMRKLIGSNPLLEMSDNKYDNNSDFDKYDNNSDFGIKKIQLK